MANIFDVDGLPTTPDPTAPEARHNPAGVPLLNTTVKYLLIEIKGLRMAVAVEDPRFLLAHAGYVAYSTCGPTAMGRVAYSILPRNPRPRPRVRYYVRYCSEEARWVLSYAVLGPGDSHPNDAGVASAISIVGLEWQDPDVTLRFGHPPCSPPVNFNWPDPRTRPSGVFQCVNDGTMIRVGYGDMEITSHQFFHMGIPLIRKFAWNPRTEIDFTRIAGIICRDEYDRLMTIQAILEQEQEQEPLEMAPEALQEQEEGKVPTAAESVAPLPLAIPERLGPMLPPTPVSSVALATPTTPTPPKGKVFQLAGFYEGVRVTQPL